MDTVLVLSISLLAAALSAACIMVAFAQVRIVHTLGILGRSHRDDLRTLANFAINTGRVYQNEFMRLGVRASVPEVDRQITSIHETIGGDRSEAVQQYLRTQPDINGEDPS